MQASICLLLVAYTAAAPAAQEAPAPAAERALECTEGGLYTLVNACLTNDDIDDEEYTKCIMPKTMVFFKACAEEDSEFANEFNTCVAPKSHEICGLPSIVDMAKCTKEKLPEFLESCKTAEA